MLKSIVQVASFVIIIEVELFIVRQRIMFVKLITNDRRCFKNV